MITPMDIHNKEFETGFRGYSKDEVDTFMAELSADYEMYYRENRELKDKIENLQKRILQYEQMEGTMNNTLVLAQETAENVKAAARKEADLIIQQAEQKKQQMVEDTMRSLREAQEKYAIIRNDVAVFKAKMESILNSQMQMLDGCVLGECKIDSGLQDTIDKTTTPYGDALEEETNQVYEAVAKAAAEDSENTKAEDVVD